MSKTKQTPKAKTPAPSVGPAQVKPPQGTPIPFDQMRPEDLVGKVLMLDINPAGLENVVRQAIPSHLLGQLDVRLTHVEAVHTRGVLDVRTWVVFSPRVQPVAPPPVPPTQG